MMNVEVLSVERMTRLNFEFWEKQAPLFEARMANPLFRKVAFETLNCESARQVSLRSRKTLEFALEEAEATVRRFDGGPETQALALKKAHGELSRKGGKAKPADSLQKYFEELAACDKELTKDRLLAHLKDLVNHSVIQEVTATEVQYLDNGKEKQAPISGLRHRLSRAKSAIAAQIAASAHPA
jgi:hypothetical protein